MEKQELNLLLEVFKQIRDNQLRWCEKPLMLTNDSQTIYLTSSFETINCCEIDLYLQAANALSVHFYFDCSDGKLRVAFF